MSSVRAFAVGTSLMAGLVLTGPAAAFATPTTPLTATQMVTALNNVAATTETAAAAGWRATETLNFGGVSGSGLFVMDTPHGIAVSKFNVLGFASSTVAVNHRGTYDYLSSSRERAAVKMMGLPNARYSFTADKKLDVNDFVEENGPSPVTALTEDTNHAGTETSNNDGSTTYTFTDKDKEAVALTVSGAGLITRADITETGSEGGTAGVTFAYGNQRLGLPTGAAVISAAQLQRGVAYLNMASAVEEAASEAAYEAEQMSGGSSVKVRTVRRAALDAAGIINQENGTPLVKVTYIGGGAKLQATNPWTHKSVAYTVKASGRKVVSRKA